MRCFIRSAFIALGLAFGGAHLAQAQTFTVLHDFTAGLDGAEPYAGLTTDAVGHLYGTAANGGIQGQGCSNTGCGAVFKMSQSGSGWTFKPLYDFTNRYSDGFSPTSRVVIGKDGILYGSTNVGGSDGCFGGGCGTIFSVGPGPIPPPNVLAGWTKTTLVVFSGDTDGAYPTGDLVFDQAGKLYGIAGGGGTNNCGEHTQCGTVFQLAASGGQWILTTIYDFSFSGGYTPSGGLTIDSQGNLYGVTSGGNGTVFELVPSLSGWMEKTLYPFTGIGGDGSVPLGGVILDDAGNLYGTTSCGGTNGAGTVFKLTPSGGSWTETVLYSFAKTSTFTCGGPDGKLAMGPDGSLYGTIVLNGAYSYGAIFKLVPSANGSWLYQSLHDFTGGADGAGPHGAVVLQPNGKLFGTAAFDGAYGYGVVWEITP